MRAYSVADDVASLREKRQSRMVVNQRRIESELTVLSCLRELAPEEIAAAHPQLASALADWREAQNAWTDYKRAVDVKRNSAGPK